MADPRFTYKDISGYGISTDEVKKAIAYVMDTKGLMGWGAAIYGLIKLVAMLAAYTLIMHLEKREAMIAKQKYEGEQDSKNQDAVDKDDLGGAKRP